MADASKLVIAMNAIGIALGSSRFLSRGVIVTSVNAGMGAPPVVVGSRVIVPCYRMSGRIEYHVACYSLETGEVDFFDGIPDADADG